MLKIKTYIYSININDSQKTLFRQADIDEIVDYHNKLRAKIANGEETRGRSGGQPKAANMRKMVWNDDLALVAQRLI